MCSCHSIPECCVMFSGVKLSMGSFILFLRSNIQLFSILFIQILQCFQIIRAIVNPNLCLKSFFLLRIFFSQGLVLLMEEFKINTSFHYVSY